MPYRKYRKQKTRYKTKKRRYLTRRRTRSRRVRRQRLISKYKRRGYQVRTNKGRLSPPIKSNQRGLYLGQVKRGVDGRPWILSIRSNGSRYWARY